jgi:hypothetical protein
LNRLQAAKDIFKNKCDEHGAEALKLVEKKLKEFDDYE